MTVLILGVAYPGRYLSHQKPPEKEVYATRMQVFDDESRRLNEEA